MNRKSSNDRIIHKPKFDDEDEGEEIEEIELYEKLSVQDQIEQLAVKIHLKELYNNVLKDELQMSEAGASSFRDELYHEIKSLQIQLAAALNNEKTAVQKALRSNREFQLALTDKTAAIGIPWLDDKVFDVICKLNLLIYDLKQKKMQLDEAEKMVDEIERWPRPGSLQWEKDANARFQKYECEIEAMKVKLETLNILHSKYVTIEYTLKEEHGKYTNIIRTLMHQLRIFQKELGDLQNTLTEAVKFRDKAVRNLGLTYKEFNENRRNRRSQMNRMKTAVQRVLQTASSVHNEGKGLQKFSRLSVRPDPAIDAAAFNRIIAFKRENIEKFEEKARNLVETMRVPNLTHIPIRYQCVMSLAERLNLELTSKEQMLNSLIHQKAQLYIILAHFSYTGHTVAKEFENRVKQYTDAINESEGDIRQLDNELDKIGDKFISARVGSLRLLEQLKRYPDRATRFQGDVPGVIRLVTDKVRNLVNAHQEWKDYFGSAEPYRNYEPYVKEPPLPPRLYRAGLTQGAEEENLDSDHVEDDIEDFRVPTRLDIKARSLKFIQHAMIRRGSNQC